MNGVRRRIIIFAIISSEKVMIELGSIRNRVKGYQQVATFDDEFDDTYDGSSIPPLKVYGYDNMTGIVKPPSKSCITCICDCICLILARCMDRSLFIDIRCYISFYNCLLAWSQLALYQSE